MMKIRPKYILSLMIATAMLMTGSYPAQADPIKTLRNAIQGRQSDIENVEDEIRQIEVELNSTIEEKRTLQQIVDDFAAEQRRLENKIVNANQSISSLEQLIEEIDTQIQQIEAQVSTRREALKDTLQSLQIANDDSLIEGFLRSDSLSDYWQETDVARQMSVSINESMSEIREAKSALVAERERQISEQERVAALKQEVVTTKQSVDIARSEQDRLLAITKNEESSFQSLLEEKRELRQAFESDLASYENQLNFVLNPATIPQPADETLSWPLSSITITQYFGNTAFAQSGAYNGNGHNGIDLGLSVGTPVLAAREGVIKGTGDTDSQCPYASYGKWVLIEHDNGLSTLYAHLSGINVSTGQTVSRGQVIGYGGNTGYSTGPHLHFTVYASDGVRVGGLPSRSCPGTTITLPLADHAAYLNPLEYLP